MKLHLVGGFLGSGKTTAIASAARLLIDQDQRVGVVTNDQGKYLVDTVFMNQLNIPAVEVSGGCFCCNYDDLDDRLRQLEASQHPDVVFAESVGSCADIVATVVKPLLELSQAPASFSVFTDGRLLRQRLLDRPLPFSDDVIYIFDKQIEEAGLLVINKIDLLKSDEAEHTARLARERYPDKIIRLQNSLADEGIAGWLNLLNQALPLPSASLDIDYDRYGAGEAALAWLDQGVRLSLPGGDLRAVIIATIQAIVDRLRHQQTPVGHLKFLIDGQQAPIKISFVTLDETDWQPDIPDLTGDQVTLMVNARVQLGADVLRDAVSKAVAEVQAQHGGTYEALDVAYFHPAYPRPTHRRA